MVQPAHPQIVHITHLRDCLGIAYQHVVNTDEPIIVQRYNRQDVALVPLWEWEFLKGIEAAIRAGERPWKATKRTTLRRVATNRESPSEREPGTRYSIALSARLRRP